MKLASFRLLSLLAAALLALPPAAAAEEPSEPEPQQEVEEIPEFAHPLRVRPALDLAITFGAAVPYLVLYVGAAADQPVALPTQAPQVSSFDRLALGHFRPDAARASDVLLYSLIAAPLVIHGVEAGASGRDFGPRFGTDALVLAETLAVTGLVTELFKGAIGRYRPFTYLDPSDFSGEVRDELVEEQSEPDVMRSWPSGHSSISFAMAAAGSTLLAVKQKQAGGPVGPVVAVYGVTLGAATVTATLRVVAGKHYPSDVISGSFLGLGLGVAIPLLHQRLADLPGPIRELEARQGRARLTALSVVPAIDGDFRGLVVSGMWR